MFSLGLLLVVSSVAVFAELTPTAPGPGDTFAAGSPCTIQWDVDTSGKWTNVSIREYEPARAHRASNSAASSHDRHEQQHDEADYGGFWP